MVSKILWLLGNISFSLVKRKWKVEVCNIVANYNCSLFCKAYIYGVLSNKWDSCDHDMLIHAFKRHTNKYGRENIRVNQTYFSYVVWYLSLPHVGTKSFF